MTTMPDVNMQPLRDLLATHPEECAAIVAFVAGEGYDGTSLAELAGDVSCHMLAADRATIVTAAEAMISIGLMRAERGIAHFLGDDRYAIARMGAAAWLLEKCPRTDKHRGFDLSNARLHEIAADAMRSAVSEDDRAIAYKVRAVADGAVPFAAIDYRGCLMAMVKRGARLDVDAEVAAVWGKAEKDGEQR